MAPNSKKRLVQIPAPSASSSSSEEQQDSSSSSEEEQENPQPVTLKPHQQQQDEDEDEDDSAEDDDEETEESDEPEKPALKNPSLKKPQSESESESKEDEESDSDDKESDSDDDDEAIKSPMVSDFTLKPRVPNSAKRATENSGSSSKNKKVKVSNGGDGQIVRSPDDAKKSFSRVWSADDEIKLLEGVIAYKAENGSDSITNLGPFHETVKDLNLSLDVTRTRLYEKLRALKKKYQNNVAKKGDIVFSKPHELKLYKLSEIIWGGEEGGLNEESGSKVKSTPDKKKSNKAANVSVKKSVENKDMVKKSVENKDMVKKSVENKDMVKTDQVSDEIKDDALDVGSLYPRLVASIELEASTHLPVMSINSKDFSKEMVLKLGKEKAKELEEEWNDYTEMEHRLFAKRLQMIHKHAETFSDVMKH